MTSDEKKWILEASMEELFRKWRFAPVGDSLLQGETGEFFKTEFFKRRDANPAKYTEISEKIGL